MQNLNSLLNNIHRYCTGSGFLGGISMASPTKIVHGLLATLQPSGVATHLRKD